MIINKKLFDDTFLNSHENLAIKCLGTLNACKNFIFFQTWKDNSFNYVLIPINDSIFVNVNTENILKINIEFSGIFLHKAKNYNIDWGLISSTYQSRIYLVIDTTVYYISMNRYFKINQTMDNKFFEINTYLNHKKNGK